jgi:hypothetical protein
MKVLDTAVPKRVLIEYTGTEYQLTTPDGRVLATAPTTRALSNFAFGNGADEVTSYFDPTVLPGWYGK